MAPRERHWRTWAFHRNIVTAAARRQWPAVFVVEAELEEDGAVLRGVASRQATDGEGGCRRRCLGQ